MNVSVTLADHRWNLNNMNVNLPLVRDGNTFSHFAHGKETFQRKGDFPRLSKWPKQRSQQGEGRIRTCTCRAPQPSSPPPWGSETSVCISRAFGACESTVWGPTLSILDSGLGAAGEGAFLTSFLAMLLLPIQKLRR